MTFKSVWYDTTTGWAYAVTDDDMYSKPPGAKEFSADWSVNTQLQLIRRIVKLQIILDDEEPIDPRDRVSEVM